MLQSLIAAGFELILRETIAAGLELMLISLRGIF